MALAEPRVSPHNGFVSLFACVAAVLLGILFAATSDSVVPPGGMAVTGIGGAVAVVRLFQIYRTLKIIRRI